MTSSITPITAASSGGTTTTTDSSVQGTSAKPEQGITRLRETEVYHLTSLVESALSEAERMVRQVHDKARERFLDHDNSGKPLDADEISRALSDAYQCATVATTYIDKAVMGLLDSGGNTPF
jgi:hypothetical protein